DTASTRRLDFTRYTSGQLEIDDSLEPDGTWQTIPDGMDFTDLNSNLQISALTSVDIDPRNVNRYVVATARNGFADVDPRIGITRLPINRWLTMDIYGPTDRIDSIGNLETQDGGFVYFGGIDPNAPPNTPEKLFRNFQHEHNRGIRVESSERDGLAGSWTLDQ